MMNKKNCMILNLWACRNYGAILTSFGVQCLFENIGYSPKVINYFPTFFAKEHYKNTFTQKFVEKYFHLTQEIKSIDDFNKLNQECSNFVVGSDQVWNFDITKTHHENASEWVYLLDFVKSNAKKISYSASFGVNEFPKFDYSRRFYKHYLTQFDAISVRENSGIEILKNTFNIDGVQLIDGAFHIPKSMLDELTQGYEKKEKYVGYFSLPGDTFTKEHEKYLKNLAKLLNLPFKRMAFDEKISVEEWLAFIKNSDFFVTGSYHASVFAILFNKPFLQVKHKTTQARFESLYEVLNMNSPAICIDEALNIDKIQNAMNIEWESVNLKISEEVKKAQEWVLAVLNKEKEDNLQNIQANILVSQTQKEILKIRRQIGILTYQKNKTKIWFNYLKFKILAFVVFGRKKQFYTHKSQLLRSTINKYS